MSNEPQEPPEPEPRRRWPWFVLAALLLGIVLFVVWVWFAVQGVKRIKASTEGLTSWTESGRRPLNLT